MLSNLNPSPLYRLDNLSEYLKIDLWVKRDDLIPLYLGGNKVRKNLNIISEHQGDVDVLITNGGSQSNHARVVALLGAQLGYTVELVLHGNIPKNNNGNTYFLRSSGARLHYVNSNDISSKISEIEKHYQSIGKKYLIIPGGAHSPSGVNAYSYAFEELDFHPNKVLLASGTGGTQAGLILGAYNNNAQTDIIGISVARNKQRGSEEIAKVLPPELPRGKIIFNDTFTFGGYEQYSDELLNLISFVLKKEGLPLDPTYTAKAMYGLFKMVESNEIQSGERVLFWHTGGLMNLQSTQGL